MMTAGVAVPIEALATLRHQLSSSAIEPTNTAKPDIVVMAITSQLRPSPGPGEVWLGQWQGAGLLKPSAVKPVFATLEQTLVIRQLWTLAASDQAALRKAIAEIVG